MDDRLGDCAVGGRASVRQLVAAAQDRLGGVDILVNCAASQVATVIAFLASPLSVSINGESIACGGGTPGVIRY
jgi:hypothetical protein